VHRGLGDTPGHKGGIFWDFLNLQTGCESAELDTYASRYRRIRDMCINHFMIIRFSRLRTFLLTSLLGLAAASIRYDPSPYVDVPKVGSDVPIVVRLCPDWQSGRGYIADDGSVYFSEARAIDCTPSGGGAGGPEEYRRFGDQAREVGKRK
jgi:hypothetical protein